MLQHTVDRTLTFISLLVLHITQRKEFYLFTRHSLIKSYRKMSFNDKSKFMIHDEKERSTLFTKLVLKGFDRN